MKTCQVQTELKRSAPRELVPARYACTALWVLTRRARQHLPCEPCNHHTYPDSPAGIYSEGAAQRTQNRKLTALSEAFWLLRKRGSLATSLIDNLSAGLISKQPVRKPVICEPYLCNHKRGNYEAEPPINTGAPCCGCNNLRVYTLLGSIIIATGGNFLPIAIS